MRTRIVLAGFASALACAAMAIPAGAQASTTHGTFIPASTHSLLAKKNAATSSLNWSGYALSGSNINAVKSDFTVPSVSALPPGFSSNWVGIGGYTTSDLIQAGTAQSSFPLLGDYHAWYEILPAGETPISNCVGDAACTVSPGDKMTVDIHETTTPGMWSISMKNGTKWTYQITIPYASTKSSAEWIFEAPTLVVQTIPANAGTSYFGQTSTYTDGAGTHTIAQGPYDSIAMGPGLINEATPSALAPNGQSFNVCAYKQSCPAPTS